MQEVSDTWVEQYKKLMVPEKKVTYITVKYEEQLVHYVYIPELDLLTEKPF
jgi:hypothetical protein